MYYRRRHHIRKLTRANFKQIEADARAHFYGSVPNPNTDVELIQYQNPARDAVVVVRRGTQSGSYTIFTGNPKYLGHNGYTFEKRESA